MLAPFNENLSASSSRFGNFGIPGRKYQPNLFIDYIISTKGKAGLLEILGFMKNGATLRKAILQALGTPLYKIEEDWQASLKQNIVWFAHLSYYLYEILFALGGLMVVYAFIKVLRKKRAYMEEE